MPNFLLMSRSETLRAVSQAAANSYRNFHPFPRDTHVAGHRYYNWALGPIVYSSESTTILIAPTEPQDWVSPSFGSYMTHGPALTCSHPTLPTRGHTHVLTHAFTCQASCSRLPHTHTGFCTGANERLWTEAGSLGCSPAPVRELTAGANPGPAALVLDQTLGPPCSAHLIYVWYIIPLCVLSLRTVSGTHFVPQETGGFLSQLVKLAPAAARGRRRCNLGLSFWALVCLSHSCEHNISRTPWENLFQFITNSLSRNFKDDLIRI